MLTSEDRHRNLLISLSIHYVEMIELHKQLRKDAIEEPEPGRKSGLFCYANVTRRDAYRLKELMIRRDGSSMLKYFGCINLMTIAKQEIKVSSMS